MTYDDFPACVSRYGWLITAAERNISILFNDGDPHYCKVCGDPVARTEWERHRREHVRQLQQTAALRQREATARLRQISRLRAEARDV